MLLKRSAYDQHGNYRSATFMDYLLPTECDIPRIEVGLYSTVMGSPRRTGPPQMTSA